MPGHTPSKKSTEPTAACTTRSQQTTTSLQTASVAHLTKLNLTLTPATVRANLTHTLSTLAPLLQHKAHFNQPSSDSECEHSKSTLGLLPDSLNLHTPTHNATIIQQ